MSEVKIKEVMIKNVYPIGPEEKIALMQLKMLRYGVGALPVEKENDTLVGNVNFTRHKLIGNEYWQSSS